MTQSDLRCCIGGEPASPNNIIGGRAYCDRHFEMVNKHHMGFWRAGLTQILLMGVFSAVVAFIADGLPQLDQSALVIVGLLLAIVPTAWWLIFFYREDQLEPEPKEKIAEVFFVALLVTYALEPRSPRYVLAFAGACLASSIYGFLQGAWPFGVVEVVWCGVALRRWRARRLAVPTFQ